MIKFHLWHTCWKLKANGIWTSARECNHRRHHRGAWLSVGKTNARLRPVGIELFIFSVAQLKASFCVLKDVAGFTAEEKMANRKAKVPIFISVTKWF